MMRLVLCHHSSKPQSMQTKIMYSLVALFMTTVTVAQQPLFVSTTNDNNLPAKEASFDLSIIPDKTTTAFVLFINNPEKRRVKVEISNQVYGVVVDTSFTGDQFSCRYNFEKVEDGYYLVTLTSGKERITRKVEINTITRRNLVVR
jgi:hypothetical protein